RKSALLARGGKKQQQRTASHNSQKSSKTTGDNRHPVRASPPSIPTSRPAHRLRVLPPHDFRMPCHYGDSLTLLVSARADAGRFSGGPSAPSHSHDSSGNDEPSLISKSDTPAKAGAHGKIE